jgi:CDP-paratose 2-epimerase
MPIAVVTGSAGLIGAEAVRFFSQKGFAVVGLDNNYRRRFFGEEASTAWSRLELEETVPQYRHYNVDICRRAAVRRVFQEYGSEIRLVIHTAAQPSHDWAARRPGLDFQINAAATLGLLECLRKYCPQAAFIFTSTNKVYGDNPNRLPLVEQETRWEVQHSHPYAEHGIDEQLSVDRTLHSLFGVSKLAADALVQEYGRYFGLNTVCFRCGCLTGPGHSGAVLHGFLSYLVKCAITRQPYTIFGYKGKQVRDNLHAYDLVNMFWHYYQAPRPGEVYNAGGGRWSHCSVREAIGRCEAVTGRRMEVAYQEEPRRGDHVWYISDVRKFQGHYPAWSYRHDLEGIVQEIFEGLSRRGVGSLEFPSRKATQKVGLSGGA